MKWEVSLLPQIIMCSCLTTLHRNLQNWVSWLSMSTLRYHWYFLKTISRSNKRKKKKKHWGITVMKIRTFWLKVKLLSRTLATQNSTCDPVLSILPSENSSNVFTELTSSLKACQANWVNEWLLISGWKWNGYNRG